MNHNEAAILEHTEVAQVLKTHLLTGLTSFEARERLIKYGSNKLDKDLESEKVHKYIYYNILKYLSQFLNPLIQLLLICVIISLSIGEYGNAISVAISILIVCTISYVQELRADKSLEKLTKRMPNICKVMRENQVHELESQNLVPGDIIYLDEGQRIPADVRLFDIYSLTVNEANLTGEALGQIKTVESASKKVLAALNSDDPSITDDHSFIFKNIALMGTLVESGHSKGIVICTGKFTRYGEVYSMLKSTVQPRSPLQVNIDQLSLHLVVASCSIIAIMSMLGIIQRRSALEVGYYAISLAVTAIPEGLPVVVAVIMALGVLRLIKQKTIVRSLNSIETLGCIQILCADKTGTLTRNDMTLTDIVTSELHSLSSEELEELNNEECRKHMTFNKFGGKIYSIGRLMEVGTLCNNSTYDPYPTTFSSDHFIGSATECAILNAAIRMGYGDSRTKFERISEIPFNSQTRRMTVQCQRKDLPSNSPMYYIKGAWEEILNDCTYYYECGLIKPKTDEMWLEYSRICTTLGSQGLRVLALATGPCLDKLTFVGIVGIRNVPREGIKETLDKLRNDFNIDVKMITGDSKATAVAIGRNLNLISEDSEEGASDKFVMSGDQFKLLIESDMDDLAKAHEVNSKSVFYRVDTIQKADIVSNLQKLDKIVAMTGDGVNDVISLKRANLSLVMGAGADVCKEIADIIISNDNLSVLIDAVIEGKAIYHKIQSFMSYQISLSLSLIVLVAISYAVRIDTPYTVIQLLFINILADGPPAQSLGLEKIPASELDPNPRNVHEPIINCQMLRTVLSLTITLIGVNGLLYYSLSLDGKLDPHGRSLLFTCFILCTVFTALSLKSKVSS